MSRIITTFAFCCLCLSGYNSLSAKQVMWADYEANNITRANLDGSGAVEVIGSAQGAGSPSGFAIDLVHGKMYWTDAFAGTIRRANLDGTQLENLPSTGARFQMDVDPIGGKMFWADNFGHAIASPI